MIGNYANIENDSSMADWWMDMAKVLGGAGSLKVVQTVVGSYKERKEEKRKDDLHDLQQLKEQLDILSNRLGQESARVDELLDRIDKQDDIILNLKREINSKTLEVSTLMNQKRELEENIKDLEQRLEAAVARGAAIAAQLEAQLQWYKAELATVLELYRQATGKNAPASLPPKEGENGQT